MVLPSFCCRTECRHLKAKLKLSKEGNGLDDDVLKLTVEPVASERVNPSPAGTVNPLMLTVVQSAAPETSEREFMVAVQSTAALALETASATTATRSENMV